jgi:alpha-L-fucosidase
MRNVASVLLLALAAPAWPQGGGDLNPDLRTPAAALERYRDLRVGLSIHWGPDALTGNEISWSRLAKRWGMRYVMPTAKHHDGFALWFSRYSPYTIEKTPLHRDIMKELGDACRRNGIVFGTYYSNLDWYHPDWTPYEPQPGPLFERHADTPNLQRYLAYMKDQVTELIRDYGVELIQFDGDWPETWTHEIGGRMYRDLRAAGPQVILGKQWAWGKRRGCVRAAFGRGGGWLCFAVAENFVRT